MTRRSRISRRIFLADLGKGGVAAAVGIGLVAFAFTVGFVLLPFFGGVFEVDVFVRGCRLSPASNPSNVDAPLSHTGCFGNDRIGPRESCLDDDILSVMLHDKGCEVVNSSVDGCETPPRLVPASQLDLLESGTFKVLNKGSIWYLPVDGVWFADGTPPSQLGLMFTVSGSCKAPDRVDASAQTEYIRL